MRKNIFFYDISSFTPDVMKKLVKAAKKDDFDSIDPSVFETENNDKRFITANITEEQSETHIQALDEYDAKSEKAAKLPSPYNILFHGISIVLIGCLLLFVWLNAKGKLSEIFPVISVMYIILFAVWYALRAWEQKRKKSKFDIPEVIDAQKELESVERGIIESLGMPKDSVKADILAFSYFNKKELEEFISSDIRKFSNSEYYIGADGENLYLSDVDTVISVKLDDIVKIEKVDVKCRFPLYEWHKSIRWNDISFSEYGVIEKRNTAEIEMPYYYVAVIKSDGEEFEISFPPYELKLMSKLSGKNSISF